MNICQLLLSTGGGGLEKHVRELSISLHKAGHSVSVIADPQFLETLPAHIQGFPVNTEQSRRNPLLWFSVLYYLHKSNADIVHAQANKATAVLNKCRYFHRAKTVGTLHNIKSRVKDFAKLDQAIAVSHSLRSHLNIANATTIYNGISTPKVAPIDIHQEFGLNPELPTFCAVGRLVKAKGFDLLLDAADGLALNLLIIGEGEERQWLHSRIQQMSTQTHCRLVGYRPDVSSLMHACDGVLISSRREGFSYVVSEALLLGKPILSTNVPVANEVLDKALITPIADTQAFRQQLATLSKDIVGWQGMMQKAMLLAQQSMTLEAMTDNTLSVYQGLLEP
ncbi:glycosyltransferase family 4 protein [Methylophaga sp.]|uniref:glycosyltransferase family 4 protein n=1 Tax=Methylophaga sp. TaxID=2024840 RepID=UPI003A9214A0